jgi:hypothetical protein
MTAYEYIDASPSASYWLKFAAAGQQLRDPLDALQDAEMLLEAARQRYEKVTGRPANGTS